MKIQNLKAEDGSVLDQEGDEICYVHSNGNHEVAKLFAAAPELLEALQQYESFFKTMFSQCCSNPVYDSWGNIVDLTKINEAHCLAGKAIKKALGDLS